MEDTVRRANALDLAQNLVLSQLRQSNDIFAKAASDWHHQDEDAKSIAQVALLIVRVAYAYDAFLQGSVSMSVTVGDAYDQPTANATTNPVSGGTAMQLKDNQQVDITVATADAKGYQTADLIDYSGFDATIVTVIGADDDDSHTATVVAGAVGTTTITITDNAVTPALSTDFLVEVIAGDTTAVNVTSGDPVDQPVAAPAPGSGDAGTGDGTSDGSGDTSGTGTSDAGDGTDGTVPSA